MSNSSFFPDLQRKIQTRARSDRTFAIGTRVHAATRITIGRPDRQWETVEGNNDMTD